jgi:hypothetical protein
VTGDQGAALADQNGIGEAEDTNAAGDLRDLRIAVRARMRGEGTIRSIGQNSSRRRSSELSVRSATIEDVIYLPPPHLNFATFFRGSRQPKKVVGFSRKDARAWPAGPRSQPARLLMRPRGAENKYPFRARAAGHRH